MDINFYLQGFEDRVRSYAGDDPLDPWDKFVEFLDCRMAGGERNSLVVVLERLVQRFLQDKRYSNDPRYIRHCVSLASYYSDPIKLYSYVHSCGVGARAAPLYVAWAQHFERKGLISQAEQVYQRAIENRAEPLDTVQQQYRLFQSRTAKSHPASSDNVRNPLQNSQLVNQSQRQRETLESQCKEPENSPADRTVRIVSRSENNPKPSSCSSSVECVSMYCVKELECEGSELSFEELRARRYFTKRRQQELQRKQEEAIRRWEEEEEEVVRMKKLLEELNSKLSTDEQEIQTLPSQQELIGAESCRPQDPLDRSARPALTPAVPETAATHPVCEPELPSSSFMGLQPAPERPLLKSEEGRESESHLLWSSAKDPASRLSLSRSAAARAQHGFGAAAASPSDSDMRAAALQRPADQRTVSQAERSVLKSCAQNPAAPERDTSEHVEADAHADAHADMSHGAFNHSHVTPNTSLGLISATPSRALPSPTVNTREALDVIMDMFQAPTLLQDTLFNTTSHAADDSFEKKCRVDGFAPSSAKPPSAPFRIYQDENGENRREEVENTRPAARALMEIPVSKPNDTPVGVESLTDESAMWGPRYASITACPNHTRDFAMSAHLVSTPLHPTTPYTWDTEHNQENRGFSGTEENPYQRQPAKLSPILEQSPSEEKPSEAAECSMRAQGTIVGEGVSLPQQSHTLSQTHSQTSCSLSRNPLALNDHTAEPIRALDSTTKPSWSIYQSPERTGQMDSNREPLSNSVHSVREPKPDQRNSTGLQANSSFTTKPSWSIYQGPERTSQTGSNGELLSNSMHLVREPKPDQLNSTGLQANSSFTTKPSWSIYQGPERTSQTGSNGELLSNSMHLVREPKPDQLNSTGLQANSSFTTKPSWSIYQGPERTSQTGSNGELLSNSMHLVREPNPDQLNSTGLKANSSFRSKPSWSIYQGPERTSQTGSNGEMHSNSMHLVKESNPDQLNSTDLQVNSSFTTKSSWSIYQSPERPSLTGSNGELHSNSMHLVRETKPDQLNSTGLQANSSFTTKPSWNIYQNPERTSLTGSNREHTADQLSSAGLQVNRGLNSSFLHLATELKPDQPHSSGLQPLGVDVCSGQGEADLLLPKRSFHRRKSEKQQNPEIHQDVPMSSEPALGFGWLQVDSPAQVVEPDLDVMVRSPQTYRTTSGSLAAGSKPCWSVYQSPEKPSEPQHIPQSPEPMEESDHHPFPTLEQSGILLSKRSFNRRKSEKRVLEVVQKSLLSSPKQASHPIQDVPMSPEPAPGLNWLCAESPARMAEPDLDVLMTPPQKTSAVVDVSPAAHPLWCDVPMSPLQGSGNGYASSVLVSDPWDEDLIASLLSSLKTPLSSYPNLSVWTHSLPAITPKMTVQMGEESLQVDFVLGQGAFATVYQATNLTTSDKLILKVQKPANPWEFYINSQLDGRVQPRARHLFNQLHSAHLFTSGSVLMGELHNCGTLLSVVNLYKSRSEKLMPAPLVLYFSVCILQMVEQLHRASIVHADIKPDNFLLGERFLENEAFDAESLDHGLVLIDFGQSIDMTLFPQGTAFTARCMTSGFQCTEMLSGRPWNYQTDYFGIAGTVYCMIFGSYMQVRNEGGVWKTNGVFKRNPHADLWQEFFHVLLNVPDCNSLPSLRRLRERLSATLQENYSNKLRSLKNRLVVQILEARSSRR